MFEAGAIEFPFVEALPKREKSRLVKAWDLINELSRVSETEGQLIPLMLAAVALNISRSRMDQLIAEGRLKRVTIHDHVFVTQNSLVAFASCERKSGRPPKQPTNSDMWKISKAVGREISQKILS